MEFPRQEYWVGSHFLLQGIFPTEGSNLCLLRWQACSLLSHLRSPLKVMRVTEIALVMITSSSWMLAPSGHCWKLFTQLSASPHCSPMKDWLSSPPLFMRKRAQKGKWLCLSSYEQKAAKQAPNPVWLQSLAAFPGSCGVLLNFWGFPDLGDKAQLQKSPVWTIPTSEHLLLKMGAGCLESALSTMRASY